MEKIKRILLIDDDTISSWLNQTMLERTGLVENIDSIFDGQSAINYLQQCCAEPVTARDACPDVIFLDLDMPVINGFKVLEVLQETKNSAWLISDRIIVLTTSINPTDMKEANRYPIHDFLVKPLTETKIKAVLERFLAKVSE